MKVLKDTINYIKKIYNWLIDGTYFMLSAMAIIITIAYYFGCRTFNPQIVSGLFLIIGIVIIIWQMLLDANLYSNSNPKTITNWVKHFPRFKPRIKNLEIIVSDSIKVSDNAILSNSIDRKATVEDKINFLFSEFTALESTLISLKQSTKKNFSDINVKLGDIKSEISENKNKLESMITGITIGNYDIRMFSVVITLCGTLIQLFTT